LGTASYSIYLWQQLLYSEKGVLPWPLALALAAGLGFLAHRLWDDRLHRAAASALRAWRKPEAPARYAR
jgi:peptidoglycan/LPS O-acetylase OafA/YrhL